MAWVVDTCLLIDVAEADSMFGVASAKLLDGRRADWKRWRESACGAAKVSVPRAELS